MSKSVVSVNVANRSVITSSSATVRSTASSPVGSVARRATARQTASRLAEGATSVSAASRR